MAEANGPAAPDGNPGGHINRLKSKRPLLEDERSFPDDEGFDSALPSMTTVDAAALGGLLVSDAAGSAPTEPLAAVSLSAPDNGEEVLVAAPDPVTLLPDASLSSVVPPPSGSDSVSSDVALEPQYAKTTYAVVSPEQAPQAGVHTGDASNAQGASRFSQEARTNADAEVGLPAHPVSSKGGPLASEIGGTDISVFRTDVETTYSESVERGIGDGVTGDSSVSGGGNAAAVDANTVSANGASERSQTSTGGMASQESPSGAVVGSPGANDPDGTLVTFVNTDIDGDPFEDPIFEIVGDEMGMSAGADLDVETAGGQSLTDVSMDITASPEPAPETLIVGDVAEAIAPDGGGVSFADASVAELRVTDDDGDDPITGSGSAEVPTGRSGWDTDATSVGDGRASGGELEDTSADGGESDTAAFASDLSDVDLPSEAGTQAVTITDANATGADVGTPAMSWSQFSVSVSVAEGAGEITFGEWFSWDVSTGESFPDDFISLDGNDLSSFDGIEDMLGEMTLPDTAGFTGDLYDFDVAVLTNDPIIANWDGGTDSVDWLETFVSSATGHSAKDFEALAESMTPDGIVVDWSGTVGEIVIDGGGAVGILETLDGNSGDSHGYTPAFTPSGETGIVDDAMQVLSSETLDFESDESVGLTIRVNDPDGASQEESLTVTVDSFVELHSGSDDGETALGISEEDYLIGDTVADTPNADDGHDTLSGDLGSDLLTGGNGAETALFDQALAETAFWQHTDGSLGVWDFETSTMENIVEVETLQFSDVTLSFQDITFDGAATGTAGDDVVIGTMSNDTISTGAGNDHVSGMSGAETISLGDGIDFADGSFGADTIYGGTGNDLLRGGDGNDVLEGGAGNDILIGGAGQDTISGGDEMDTAVFDQTLSQTAFWENSDGSLAAWNFDTWDWDNISDVETLQFADQTIAFQDLIFDGSATGTSGDDVVIATNSDDMIATGDGNDHVSARSGDDVVSLGGGDDVSDGSFGADTIYGGAGNDLLRGGDGNDVLEGGAGDDTMYGGAGNDSFLVSTMEGTDTISGGGGGWTDSIDFGGVGSSFVVSGNTVDGDGWTMTLDSSHAVSAEDPGSLTLTEDAAATITFDSGGAVDFAGIERFTFG